MEGTQLPREWNKTKQPTAPLNTILNSLLGAFVHLTKTSPQAVTAVSLIGARGPEGVGADG